ncbi:MAG: hypothetical protein M0009_01545, partial [Deltaproteobacteria bacterium]|nr:hypothetical protein [Deltaproteobacteria bacterium]
FSSLNLFLHRLKSALQLNLISESRGGCQGDFLTAFPSLAQRASKIKCIFHQQRLKQFTSDTKQYHSKTKGLLCRRPFRCGG